MNILSWLFGSGIKQAADGISEVGHLFTEDKENASKRKLLEDLDTVSKNYKNIKGARSLLATGLSQDNSLWESFVNGLIKLPFAIIVFGVIYLFVFAFVNPNQFSIVMQALNLIPPELWALLGAIKVFYFGGVYFAEHTKNKSTEKILHTMIQNPPPEPVDNKPVVSNKSTPEAHKTTPNKEAVIQPTQAPKKVHPRQNLPERPG